MMPVQQPLLNLGLHDGLRFESFYPSTSNALLLEEAKASVSSPEHKQLFIWGGDAVGKSHLLQACCYAAFSEGVPAAYMPLSSLKNHGVAIFSGSSIYKLICIDDIEVIIGNNDWETALFNLINQARIEQQVLLFSAKENPRHMECVLPDLQSRLLWGGTFQINELDDDEKAEALKFRASQRGIELDNAVIEYIYKRYPRDFTTLMEILDRLDQESMSSKRKVTIPLVKEALIKSGAF